jgi:hypothetical protein
MQINSQRIVHLASPAPADTPPAQAASATELTNRLENLSPRQADDAQAIAKDFIRLLNSETADPALLDCLQGCCELVEIIEELDDFQPQGNSIKERKQRLEDAVLGLGRLLNTNQAALKTEKSLDSLLKFAKALGTAAEANLPKPHAEGSGKFNAQLRQQEQAIQTIENHINKNEDALLTEALPVLKKSIDLNTQPQQFGDAAKTQLESMQNMALELNAQLQKLAISSVTSPPENLAIHAEMKTLLQHQQPAIEMKIEVLNNYISPLDASKLCQAKARCVSAAQTVLQNELRAMKVEDYAVGKQILKNLSMRIELLEKPTEETDIKKLIGQKKMGFLQQLLHPTRAGRQEGALKARASLYATSNIDPKNTKAATQFFTEEMFMQAVLEEALKPLGYSSSHIKELLHKQLSEIHNGKNWEKINSKFSVPLKSAQGAQIMVPVSTQTTPAGHHLTDAATFSIVSTDSPITNETTAELRGGDAANPTIRGVNSHCATEATHCTSLATTSMQIAGEEVFSATRHGVCSSYDLTTAYVQALPVDKREKIMQETLVKQASHQPTQVVMGRPAEPEDAKQLPDLPDTKLQIAIKLELKKLGIEENKLDEVMKDKVFLADLAEKSPTLCQLVKRAANLNRAREVFLTELKHNKKLQARLEQNKPIKFNSISLLTPDELRATQNAITGTGNAGNEKQMQIDQFQAWEDLQAEIDGGGLLVNGKQVDAHIRCFNFGVNKGAVHLSSNPVIGELVSGWNYVDAKNAVGMHELFGDPQDTSKPSEVREFLQERSAELQKMQQKLSLLLTATPPDQTAIQELDSEIKAMAADMHVVEQLHDQITQMWVDKSYRQAGNEPYKMVTRMALLSYLMEGGTLFNCKSGKDRTGELDIEAKFLAFQIHTSGGTVPVPDRERTDLEKIQLAVFMFEDESRRTMQEYNTGYGGSKLTAAPEVYASITPAGSTYNATIAEFLGGSKNAGS